MARKPMPVISDFGETTDDDGAWIGVDLDGTLAVYEGYQGPGHIGAPVKPMVDRVKRWLDGGIKVKIMTARGGDPEAVAAIQSWTEENGMGRLPVTNKKDFNMIVLYDDRAVAVETNTGRLLSKEVENA